MEQMSAIGKMIVESQTLDGDGKELVNTCTKHTFTGRLS